MVLLLGYPPALLTCLLIIILLGTVLGIEALKERVDRSSLPSQQVATSRLGVRNVSQNKKGFDDSELYNPLKEGEEAHWEVSGVVTCIN